ncbi:MAG TPA: HYR domain-containing protein, partial [Haliangiales bacterium]|nr:HYR domain-containing protein [Haliangiales bacterium]
NTWDNAGDFYVRVRGRNGAFSPGAPFHLQVFMVTGACGQVSSVPLDAQHQPLPSSTFAAPAGGYKTIILTDLNRQIGPGPSQEKTDLQNKLATFAARPEVKGVVVEVGADSWVSFFNAQADANFDCPYAKNLVAGAIKDVVDRSRAGNALEYVVIVGNDSVIPFFRYPDEALLGPEKNYVPPVKDFTASQAGLRLNYVLGQDQYGAHCDLSVKSTTIPVPDLAVGRLVETPAEVTAMLDAYLETTGGVVPTPNSALVTGYDFLQDTADAVRAQLETGLGATADALILDHTLPPTSPLAWTADDLRNQLLGKRHDLIFLAGHFSSIAALAADYSTHMLSSELANAPVDLKNAVLFSAGCHSGYNIVDADGIPLVTLEPDWAQACARKQATLLAGTGYQYGDTDFIEYSERIYLEFSKQLRAGAGAVPLGKALVRAKQIYLATTPQMRGIHQKAFLEATLFGLPMLSVDLPGARLNANADQSIVNATHSFTTDPGKTLGLTFSDVTVATALTPHQVVLTDADDGSTVTATYLAGGDGIINNPAEPILPLEVRNVTVSGAVLRGVGFRGGSYADVPNIFPLTGAATTEIRGVHASFFSDVYYPIKPWLVNYFDALCPEINGVTRLMALPAQFISGSSGGGGTLREYQSMNFRLFYSANLATYTDPISGIPSTPARASAPSISGVSGVTLGDQVLLSAHVTGNPAAGIQQVWVTYTAQSGPYAGQWQSLDLTQNAADSTLWEGTLPLNATPSQDLRYLVQAVNGVGVVAIDMKLGAHHVPDENDGANGSPTTVLLLTPAASGAYGTVIPFSAQLTSNGSPLAARRLRFSLGDQDLQAVTDVNGIAGVKLNLLTVPGSYELKVSFAGASGYAPSFATSPFIITRQGTAITLAPDNTYVAPNTDSHIVAALNEAGGRSLVERTVFFLVTNPAASYSLAAITDFNGRAALGPVPLPDGTYSVKAYFNGTIPLPPPNAPLNLVDESYESASSAPVSLILDSQKPVITCPVDLVKGTDPGECSAVVTYSVTATDNNPGVMVVCNPASGSIFAKGTNTVLCAATDAAGNTSSCSFQIIVRDTEKPAIGNCPANIVTGNDPGQCGAVVTFAAPTATDNCPGPINLVCSPASGSFFPTGTTTVTCTATDRAGNNSSCSFTVTVNDSEPPKITCPTDIVVGNDPGKVSAAVAFAPGSTDNCPGVKVVCNPPSGSTFPPG